MTVLNIAYWLHDIVHHKDNIMTVYMHVWQTGVSSNTPMRNRDDHATCVNACQIYYYIYTSINCKVIQKWGYRWHYIKYYEQG